MIKICFHADNDTNADAQAVNAAMVGENADLYCFVGDGPYAKTGTKWVAQQKKHFDDKKDKMVWSRGNHDTKSSESMQTQRDMEAWFPEAKKLAIGDTWLYSKQVGNVYVISMDTEDMDVEFERDQFNFVKAEIAKAKQLRQSGQIDWIVVLFHKPFFTLKSSHSPYTAVRFLYKDLFRDAQVDFAVSGHNHNTQLWKPMIPNQSQANGEGEQLFKFASDGKTFDFAQDHGALYIVTGHSAHEWNAINDSGSGVKNVMHYRDSGDFGYTLIEFDGKKAKVLSKDTTGKVHFEYNVTRDGGIITNPPPDNKPPIANAGPDQVVLPKAVVMLNGSLSTDPDGTVLQSYKWIQTSGPNVILNNPNNAITSFTAPDLTSPPPPPPTDTDIFGIKKLYPTNPNGAPEFYLGISDAGRLEHNGNISGSGKDTVINVTNSEARIFVHTDASKQEITQLNHQQYQQNQFMLNNKDWKNCEMTAAVKLNKIGGTGNPAFKFGLRGGRLIRESPGGCQGTRYRTHIEYTGNTLLRKDTRSHGSNREFDRTGGQNVGNLQGKWVVIKLVTYNLPDGNVKIEVYLDPTGIGQSFNKIQETIDNGNWGDGATDCSGTAGQKIVWGSPMALFRWDGATNVDFKWASVREISVGAVPPPPPPPPVGNNYKMKYKFGSKGTGDGQFIDPHDVTFDKDDNIYIPDRERNDIQVFTHDGKFIRKFGGPGSQPGKFNVPYSCQTGPDDTIWVCDRENSRVQKLAKDGTFIQQWTEMNGKKLNKPEDLAFDNELKFLYFTDTGNNRIIKCTTDMQFVLEWGSKGNGDSQFDHPHGIDVGPDGNVYVNSGYQPYIKKFTPEGQFIKKWGSEGTGDGQFLMFLEHLDVDEQGRVFIINNNVRPYVFIFDSDGKFLGKFGSEKEGKQDGQFAEPEHVTIDKQGRAFVVDSGNFRIQVFEADNNTTVSSPTSTTTTSALPLLTFQLTVTDDKGATANDSVTITVDNSAQPPGPDPVAIIKPDFPAGTPNSVITLDGSQSINTVTYAWSVLDGAIIVGANNQSTVQVKLPDDINAKPKVVLNAINGEGKANSQVKEIQVVGGTAIVCPYKYHYEEDLKKCIPDLEPDFEPICPEGYTWNERVCEWTGGPPPPPPDNKPPVADAGEDKTVAVKSIVTLNGSKSYDPEGTTLTTFEWKQLSGPTVSLANTDTLITNFFAPDTPATLVFQLTVTDDRGLKATDTATVTVVTGGPPPPPPQDPVAKLVAPSQVQGGQNVVLDGSQSIADTLTITQTAGQNVSLTDAGTFKKKFTAPTGGNFQLAFQAVAVKGTKQAITQIAIQVSTQTQPPPANLIWSMFNNLVTGQDFTVNDKYGPQGAGEGGIYTAASGGPFVEVKKDGTVWLCSKSGGHPRFYIKVCNYNFKETGWKMFPDSKPDDINTKGRNRHQMGGACENRQGGLGFVHQLPNLIKSKLEICHNTHTLNKEGKTSKNFEFGKWYYYENYLCDVAGGGTRRIAKIDMNGKSELPKRDEVGTNLETVIDEVIKLPDAFYKKDMFEKESEFWHRMNPASAAKAGLFDNKIYKIEESDLPPRQ